MTLSIKGTPNTSATTSVTIPTHAVGDLIVLFAVTGNSNTIPTKPTASGTVPAWVDIDTNAGSHSVASRSAYFTATATNHTSGTWTGAAAMVAVVITGQATSPIGGHAESGNTSSSAVIAPSITQTATDGSSMLLEFFGIGGTNATTWSAAPSGYTQQITPGTGKVCFDTKNDTTSDGTCTQSGSFTGGPGYRGDQIEILVSPAVPRTAALSGHGVLASTATAKFSEAATLTGHGVLVAATSPRIPVAAALPGHGALSAAVYAKFSVAANLAGHGLLQGQAQIQRAAALPGTGTLAASAVATKFTLAATLSGHGVLAAPDYAEFTEPATLTGHGVLAAAAYAKFTVSATLSGHGFLSATAAAKFSEAASLTGTGTLAATRYPKFSIAVALPGQGALSPTAQATGFSEVAALSAQGSLAGAAYAKFSETASLNGKGTLAATAAATKFTLAATALTGHGVLAAPDYAEFTEPATLSGHGALTGTAKATQFALNANLAGNGALIAARLAGYPNTHDATLPWTLPITLGGVSAAPNGHGVLAASAAATKFTLAATLSGHGSLAAAAYAKFTTPATLAGNGILTANAFSGSAPSASPALSSNGTLSGAVYAKFTETATLAGNGILAASGHATATQTLHGNGLLSATTISSPSTLPWVLPIILGQTIYGFNAIVLPGSGTLTATAKAKTYTSPHGTGLLSATARTTNDALLPWTLPFTLGQVSYAATLSGTGTLTGMVTGSILLTGVGTLTAAVNQTGVIPDKFLRTAHFSSLGKLSAHAYPAITNLASHGKLTGLIAHHRTATLSSHGKLFVTAFPTISPVLIVHDGQIVNAADGLVTQIQRT